MQRRNRFLLNAVKNGVTALLFCFFLLAAGLALAQDPNSPGSQQPSTPPSTTPAPTQPPAQPPMPTPLPPMPNDTAIPGDTSGSRILTPLDVEKKDTTQSNEALGQAGKPEGNAVGVNTGIGKSLIYVVDGKISSEEKVGALEEKDVKRIKFVKDREMISQFGGKTAKGIIMVTTRLKN